MLCTRIESELSAGRLSIPSEIFEDWMRSDELSSAAERYRAVGWTVYVSPSRVDFVMRLVEPHHNGLRHTVPGSTLAARIGSVDSPVPYLGRGGCRRGNDG
jgi:hypothetical protein